MCDTCNYQDYIDQIDNMLLNENYEFATETLEGIKTWIEEHEHVTEGQIIAIENIVNSVDDENDEEGYGI